MSMAALALATVSIVGLEWWLIQSEILTLLQGLMVFVVMEAMLISAVVLQAWRRSRQAGSTLMDELPGLHLIRHEWDAVRNVYRVAKRIHVAPKDAVILSARRGWWQVPAMLTVAIAIEVIVVDLLIPWPTVRIIVLAVSLYGLLIMWGIIAGRAVYPHYLSEELVLRNGRTVVCRAPINAIEEFRHDRSFHSAQYEIESRRLILGSSEGTNVTVVFRTPQEVALPRWPWQRRRTEKVDECALWLDDAPTALARVETYAP